MKRVFFYGIISLLGLFSTCLPSGKKGANPGESSSSDTGPLLREELIFPLDNKPTPQCHASTIVEIQGGLIVAWFGGTHENNPDVGIWISRFSDGEWSKPKEVVNGIQNDTLRYPCWNPVLFRPRRGPLMLYYKVGPSPSEWWGMLAVSENKGKTWSKAIKLGHDEMIGHLIGPVKNKPVQLEDGTIICPSSTERNDGDNTIWKVHFEISSDEGNSWEVVGPINDGVEFDAIQPSILFYQDNRMQILCRTRQNVISQSWSLDQGRTWSKMSPTELPNPNAGTDAVTLNNGMQILCYNHTTRQGEFPIGREMLNVAISKNGTAWKQVMTLEKQKGEYSYPAIIQSGDGLVHITYTYRRQSVKHVVIDPVKLISNDPVCFN
jgi:predicted neuraminidase